MLPLGPRLGLPSGSIGWPSSPLLKWVSDPLGASHEPQKPPEIRTEIAKVHRLLIYKYFMQYVSFGGSRLSPDEDAPFLRRVSIDSWKTVLSERIRVVLHVSPLESVLYKQYFTPTRKSLRHLPAILRLGTHTTLIVVRLALPAGVSDHRNKHDVCWVL
jgi:hypothetical protein